MTCNFTHTYYEYYALLLIDITLYDEGMNTSTAALRALPFLVLLLFAGACTGDIGDEFAYEGECIEANDDDIRAIVLAEESADTPLCESNEPLSIQSIQTLASGQGCSVCPAGTQQFTATNSVGESHTQTFCALPQDHRGSVLYFGFYLSTEATYNLWDGRHVDGALCRNSFGRDVDWTIFQR